MVLMVTVRGGLGAAPVLRRMVGEYTFCIVAMANGHYDNLILSDGHVFFTTDIANGIGLFCNINHEFDYLGDNEEIFSCHWS